MSRNIETNYDIQNDSSNYFSLTIHISPYSLKSLNETINEKDLKECFKL